MPWREAGIPPHFEEGWIRRVFSLMNAQAREFPSQVVYGKP
jgi:hypothetical protein